MIEVIKDKKHWNDTLAQIEHIDFYHTYDYHQLSKNDGELPILIRYTDGSTILALPLLLRPIENTTYNDAISVYGYAGILAVNMDEHFHKEKFHKELQACLNAYNIVSVFSRLHPYIDYQESLLDGLGTTTTLGKVVYIDLQESLETQRKMYSSRIKTYINTSRKTCTVIESKREDLANRRLEASDFNKLVSSDPVRDLLSWMNDANTCRERWDAARWQALNGICETEYHFSPEQDGELTAAELLCQRQGVWEGVWQRYIESCHHYPFLPY